MLRDIGEIQKLATKYSKPQLAQMAQMGLIDPTKAVMAGMMIDRITKSNMQAPQQTVAEEALTPTPPPMPQEQPSAAGIGSLPTQPEPNAGMAALPSGITEMAGGGIVAFADEGLVKADKEELERRQREELSDFFPSIGRSVSKYFEGIQNIPFEKPNAYIKYATPKRTGIGVYETSTEKLDRLRKEEQEKFIPPKVNESAAETQRLLAQNKMAAQSDMPLPPSLDSLPTPPPPDARSGFQGTKQGGDKRGPSADQSIGLQSLASGRVPAFQMDPNVGKFEIRDYKVPAKAELKDYLRQQEEADREAGVNTNIYRDLMGDLESKKGKLAERKQEAIGNALMQTGLGLLGAKRGQEFAVLGQAGQRSLQGLITANENIRSTEDKLDDARRSLLVAENDYKRTRSDKALERVEANKTKIETLENKNVDNFNKASERKAELGVTLQGQGITLRSQDITEAGNILQSKTQLAAARIQAATSGRPGESERLMSQYENIQNTQGQEVANAWLANLERVRGAGKPQNTFSFEEAMKTVAAKPTNMNASPQELAKQARELMAAGNAQMGGAPRPAGTVDANNPLLKGN